MSENCKKNMTNILDGFDQKKNNSLLDNEKKQNINIKFSSLNRNNGNSYNKDSDNHANKNINENNVEKSIPVIRSTIRSTDDNMVEKQRGHGDELLKYAKFIIRLSVHSA